ncbi:MAG: ABC transporter ATP-binding protein, partial [Candidatus Eisenbacteria bacterium]
ALGAAGLLLLELLSAALSAARSYEVRRLSQEGMYRLRRDLFARLLRLPAEFHDRRTAGELASRVRDETEVLEMCLFRGAIALLLAPAGFLGMALIMFLLHPRLALWTLVPIPVLAAVTWFFVTGLRRVTPTYRESVASWSSFLHERLQAVGLVRRLGRIVPESRAFDRLGERSRELRMQIEGQTALLLAVGGVATFFGTVVILWVGGNEVIRGSATVGNLIAFLGYLAYFYAPLSEVTRANYLLQNAAISADRIQEVFDAPWRGPEPGTGLGVPQEGAPAAEDVWFAYAEADPVLRGVSLALRRGTWTAVVGATGSGKSTLVMLLAGLRAPVRGRAVWGSVDLGEADPEALARRLAVVVQGDHLVDGTVEENVRFGAPEASGEDLDRAAAVSGLDRVVAGLAGGWSTQVGERGESLSGGERQRVCLSRALLMRPDVLLLDEATSSLDVDTERDVLRRLREDDGRRAVLLVSHRRSVVSLADDVFRLEGGRLDAEASLGSRP